MSLTDTEITAGATYTVRFEFGKLSSKRFRDAVSLVKGIAVPGGNTAEFDGTTKTWTVTLVPGAERGVYDLQTAVRAYGAIVQRVSEPAQPKPDMEAAIREMGVSDDAAVTELARSVEARMKANPAADINYVITMTVSFWRDRMDPAGHARALAAARKGSYDEDEVFEDLFGYPRGYGA